MPILVDVTVIPVESNAVLKRVSIHLSPSALCSSHMESVSPALAPAFDEAGTRREHRSRTKGISVCPSETTSAAGTPLAEKAGL